MGKYGSRAYYGDMIVKSEPFAVDTIETTGAGDTFGGCALNYILEHGLDGLTEENLSELLTFANAGAAIITTKKGALKVMPERGDIEVLISKR
jgi:fructokinase